VACAKADVAEPTVSNTAKAIRLVVYRAITKFIKSSPSRAEYSAASIPLGDFIRSYDKSRNTAWAPGASILSTQPVFAQASAPPLKLRTRRRKKIPARSDAAGDVNLPAAEISGGWELSTRIHVPIVNSNVAAPKNLVDGQRADQVASHVFLIGDG
jgi:hypothetical protein